MYLVHQHKHYLTHAQEQEVEEEEEEDGEETQGVVLLFFFLSFFLYMENTVQVPSDLLGLKAHGVH